MFNLFSDYLTVKWMGSARQTRASDSRLCQSGSSWACWVSGLVVCPGGLLQGGQMRGGHFSFKRTFWHKCSAVAVIYTDWLPGSRNMKDWVTI